MSSFSRPFLTLLTDSRPEPSAPSPWTAMAFEGALDGALDDDWRQDALCA